MVGDGMMMDPRRPGRILPASLCGWIGFRRPGGTRCASAVRICNCSHCCNKKLPLVPRIVLELIQGLTRVETYLINLVVS